MTNRLSDDQIRDTVAKMRAPGDASAAADGVTAPKPTPGGARPGAGRPQSGRQQVMTRLRPDIVRRLDAVAAERNREPGLRTSRSDLLEEAVIVWLEGL